ncbi:unnamed protein product [Adineta steineri]|uniref:DNA2/NAM7 helicase-like C-terminal domain-containing protein n=1 Tax=Adineta steineri TaxID=433720 RepID=A0A819KAQ4_9BILA|nr:unnamed protein product [Adineta steineri]CAF3944825.1 unnamed protein product [Adineta steineri]
MDSIFAIDVETILSPYGTKYTNEIELLTKTIDIYLIEGYIYNDQNKEFLIGSLKRRIHINCIIEKYQCIIDDIEILKQLDVDIYADAELSLSWIEAKMGLHIQKTIYELEKAQNKFQSNNEYEIGFLVNEQRMNVLLTRAKCAMIVFGNKKTLISNNLWKSWIENVPNINSTQFINYCLKKEQNQITTQHQVHSTKNNYRKRR